MFTRFVAAALLLALLAPMGAASHWFVHDSELDDYARRTLEDDGARMTASGNPLDGRENRVVYAGASLGDGGLFLDAIIGNRLGPSGDAGVDFYASAFVADLSGRPNLLLPGLQHVSAWYGWWSDLNTDGVINDVHDTACSGSACAEDEFTWRGVGSGEAGIAVANFVVPDAVSTMRGGGDPATTTRSDAILVDHTHPENAAQEWSSSRVSIIVDASLLASMQSFTVAGARAAAASAFGPDLDDPAGLHDVDRYESLSGDLESLWGSTVSGAMGLLRDGGDSASQVANLVLATTLGVVNGVAGPVFDALPPVRVGVPAPADAVTPPLFKEPNTVEDDFEGRAFFGGVGDRYGSRNSYAAYAEGFHFFFDAQAATHVCAGAYSRAPVVGESSLQIRCVPGNVDAWGANTVERRSPGIELSFIGDAYVWHDDNKDTYAGWACDPENPDEWDADNSTCKPQYHTGLAFKSPEVRTACPISDLPLGVITLTPIQRNWTNAIVVRDFKESTRAAFDESVEIAVGDEPITLRWGGDCGPTTFTATSRDAVIFPAGFLEGTIRVESSARIPGFYDANAGIDIGPERVIDVDHLVAAL